MDLVVENVGRRSSQWGKQGDPTDVGQHSLNGYERNSLFRGVGGGRFEEVAHLVGANRIEDGRAAVVADFDRDGRLDVLLQALDRPAVLLMAQGGAGRWLEVELVGAGANPDAVGASAVAQVGGARHTRQLVVGTGFLAASSPVLHFGLGAAERVDALEIRWPNGERQELRGVATNQRLVVKQGAALGTAAR